MQCSLCKVISLSDILEIDAILKRQEFSICNTIKLNLSFGEQSQKFSDVINYEISEFYFTENVMHNNVSNDMYNMLKTMN